MRGNVTVRASDDELARWRTAAADAGLELSKWVRRSLDEAARLEAALAAQRIEERAERERLLATAFPHLKKGRT